MRARESVRVPINARSRRSRTVSDGVRLAHHRPGAADQQAALDVAIRDGRFEKEGWRIRKGGTRFRAHVVIDPIRDDTGKIIGFAKVTRDISEKADAEAALEMAQQALFQAQKLEAVGQLTGGLAHDFNNLLAGISGCLELLHTRLLQGRINDLDRYVIAAQGSAKRAAALTHRLLAFSRQQTLDPKAIDINRLAAGMEELIRRTVGPEITVEVVGAAGLWATLADQNQLDSALLNLCINARDAMSGGGRLTIETGNRWIDDRSAQWRDVPPGPYVSLCVSDTGTGMTSEVMRRAFEPFYTTKPIGQGTGLGLSMIYGFARQSRGQVRSYSELGEGSMVCIYLPRHRGDVDVDDLLSNPVTATPANPGETVLIVDDEPTVRLLVAEVLSEIGYIGSDRVRP
jgi:signal transduction histidine kinase